MNKLLLDGILHECLEIAGVKPVLLYNLSFSKL